MQSTFIDIGNEAYRDWNWRLKSELVIGIGSGSVGANW